MFSLIGVSLKAISKRNIHWVLIDGTPSALQQNTNGKNRWLSVVSSSTSSAGAQQRQQPKSADGTTTADQSRNLCEVDEQYQIRADASLPSATTTLPTEVSRRAQRLWRSPISNTNPATIYSDNNRNNIQTAWTRAVADTEPEVAGEESLASSASTAPGQELQHLQQQQHGGLTLHEMIARISAEEQEGGRAKGRQLGVLREDPSEDMYALIHNYTVPALASALRDREDTLQLCAGKKAELKAEYLKGANMLKLYLVWFSSIAFFIYHDCLRFHFTELMASGQLEQLRQVLKPFESQYVRLRRFKNKHLDLSNGGFDLAALEMLRKGLARMSRQITQAHKKRAGVVLPLCNVNGVACVLFEKRSRHLRAHADEVCLPGGMVSVGDDKSIVVTCLREMEEEIGIRQENVIVLGTLRCNWGEVARITGIAVTPVVGFVGVLGEGGFECPDDTSDRKNTSKGDAFLSAASTAPPARSRISLNYDEVSECFTVPIASLLDKSKWIHRDDCAPIFVGGPYMIWGLTGYIVDRFAKDIVGRFTVTTHR